MAKPAVTKPMGRTGNATIMRQGHTASGNFGDDPNAKTAGHKTPRDLNAK